MRRIRITIAILTSLALCILLFAMAGCGQNITSASTAPGSSVSSSNAAPGAITNAPTVLAIGSGDTTVQVKNETGYDIIGIRIKTTDAKEYSAENSFNGFNFTNDDVIDLSFTRVDVVSNYDILLLTSEDSKIAVRDIDLIDTKNIVFHFEKGIGYISYIDTKTGESVDNKMQALESEEATDAVVSDLETQRG